MSRTLNSASHLAAVVLVLLGLALTGCSTEVDQAPRSDLVNTRPTNWSKAEAIDDSHIRVWFWGGVDDCFGHEVDLVETDSTITISLSTGRLPRESGACILPAFEYSTLVETEQPIGGRNIVDGNAV